VALRSGTNYRRLRVWSGLLVACPYTIAANHIGNGDPAMTYLIQLCRTCALNSAQVSSGLAEVEAPTAPAELCKKIIAES
jgi:hypothetical protein